MTTCPCCGQPIDETGDVRIDLDGGFVVGAGQVTRLTRSELELFLALWNVRPRLVTKQQLFDNAYWLRSDAEEPDIKIIEVHICRLRRKLAGLGVAIDTAWGQGYRVLPRQQGEAA